MAVTLEETITHTEGMIRAAGYVGQEDIRSFLTQPKYALYMRIPKHVTAYLDHFSVSYDVEKLSGGLGLFYVWLKTVDDILDEEHKSGDSILRAFDQAVVPSHVMRKLDESFLTAVVSQALGPFDSSRRGVALRDLYNLYTATCAESDARRVDDLIAKRMQVGRYTSLVSLDIMEPHLAEDSLEFRYFLIRVGEVGTLLDTALDFDRDLAARQFTFSSPSEVKRRVYIETVKQAAALLYSYPFLLSDYFHGCLSIPCHTAFEVSSL